jgi:hypothetical protein
MTVSARPPSPNPRAGAVSLGLCDLRNVFPGLNSGDSELGERRRQETLFLLTSKIARQTIRDVVLARPSAKLRQCGVCSDYKCSHSTAISGDRWPDDVRLSDVEPLFTCQVCGQRGADVRPNFSLGRSGPARGEYGRHAPGPQTKPPAQPVGMVEIGPKDDSWQKSG